ncbi:uncharacterized protein [Diadema setosum]|uniref:uncharacterized protein n=1 Tax=Diadema setosum TaxID=31175 RepID=UPI003B3B6A9A
MARFGAEFSLLGLTLLLVAASQSQSAQAPRPTPAPTQPPQVPMVLKSNKPCLNLTANEAVMPDLPADFGGSNFAVFENQEIVDRHNELRRTPAARNDNERSDPNAVRASDMEHMSWDENLAYMAYQWAMQCQFSHGQPTNVSPYKNIGQNLWAHSGRQDTPLSGVRATQDWYDEVVDYTYQTGTGGTCVPGRPCGHYTQVVWSSTNRVGCGRYFCSYLGGAFRNAWYVVCNYGPTGNWQGVQPYSIGPPCTDCGNGVGQCYNDLCRPCSEHNEACDCRQTCENCGSLNPAACTCTCPNGYYGSRCEKECIDTSHRCYQTWWPEFCEGYAQVREGCPIMCGLCNAADPDFVCDPNSNVQTAPPPPPPRVTDPPASPPAMCDLKFTAASYINGELNLFRGELVWRVGSDGTLLSPAEGELSKALFNRLPAKPTCAYELANGNVAFVRGKKLFTHSGFSRTGAPVTLASLGLPKGLQAALHSPWEERTYFFKGSQVYALNERTQRVESGYPRRIADEFPSVPSKLTAAFSDTSGNRYFVRSKKVFKISAGRNSVDAGYPKFFTETFISACRQ